MIPWMMAGMVLLAGSTAPAPRVWLADDLARVRPADPAQGPATLRLAGARNEWVGFQIIVHAGADGLRNVRVRASSPIGPRLAMLPAPLLYREHYIHVVTPSPRSKEKPGWLPDALIPFNVAPKDRVAGGVRFRGTPFDVAPASNQPVYAEIHVPKTAAAGKYQAVITVDADGCPRVRLRFTLTIWPFALPDRPACRSSFGDFSRVATHAGLRSGGADAVDLERRYEDALVAHRLMSTLPVGVWARASADGTPDMTSVEPALRRYARGGTCWAGTIPLPVSDPTGKGRAVAQRYLAAYYQYLKTAGWADEAYTYLVDEPNDAEAYARVRDLAAVVHAADRRIRFLCTEQPLPDNAAWGSLVGAVDIWCPLWALWDDTSIRERLAHGDEVWSYTALCQGKRETPFWETDFPLMSYRVASWQNWITGATGLLYWSTVYWERTKDPWTESRTYEGYNGEGMLFYPGLDAGVSGPVASLRLKAIRDGMQDYDYCALLAACRGRAAADAIVRTVARSWFDWDRNPGSIHVARERLAKAIVAARSRRKR